MSFKFSKVSLQRLVGLRPALLKVVSRALEISTVDFMVIEGVRTLSRQKQLWNQGRTTPGPKVTWTMASKHLEAKAVDICPVDKNGQPDWKNLKAFDAMAKAMMIAGNELGVAIRWGADWDRDGKPRERGESDSPHFELAE